MTAIALDEGISFLEFTIHGHTFTVDPFVANDRLYAIDKEFAVEAPAGGKVIPDEMLAAWSDALAAHIVEVYGAPRCSRHGAQQFHAAVLAAFEDIKKKLTSTPQLVIGSDSTEFVSATPESEHCSPISPDSTLNGGSP